MPCAVCGKATKDRWPRYRFTRGRSAKWRTVSVTDLCELCWQRLNHVPAYRRNAMTWLDRMAKAALRGDLAEMRFCESVLASIEAPREESRRRLMYAQTYLRSAEGEFASANHALEEAVRLWAEHPIEQREHGERWDRDYMRRRLERNRQQRAEEVLKRRENVNELMRMVMTNGQ